MDSLDYLDYFDFPPRLRQISPIRAHLIRTFQQMMYVSGETAEPPVETTSIMEDIVRQQVIEMVCYIPCLVEITLL